MPSCDSGRDRIDNYLFVFSSISFSVDGLF